MSVSGKAPSESCSNNLCYLIKHCSHFPPCVIYSPFVACSIFVVLSNFCHLLTLCYLLTFYVIISPYKCTCTTHNLSYLSPRITSFTEVNVLVIRTGEILQSKNLKVSCVKRWLPASKFFFYQYSRGVDSKRMCAFQSYFCLFLLHDHVKSFGDFPQLSHSFKICWGA